ncbi:MAG: peroxidase [Planctomycetota bacterium]|jgi:peroxidase|uniref:peroxidase family protein n=1 Tax=Patiriisocius sp. Uisw_047 TaxID=3230969 RepID=UPI0039ED9BF5
MKKKYLITLLAAFCLINTMRAQVNRSYDGNGNNTTNPEWGAADTHFRTFTTVEYSDGISEPGGLDRANPRTVSNALGSQEEFMPNELDLSDFIWGWGQFIDHDVNLNDDAPLEPFDIDIPSCDPMFDPMCEGDRKMRMFRSKNDLTTGTSTADPRRHINDVTSYIDASTVYGSDETRSDWLRSNSDGKLKVSTGNTLPWNTVDGEFDSAIDPTAPFMVLDGPDVPVKFFVGGDIRINEQPGLICFHTVMVREHNRQCDLIVADNPGWTGEEVYQRARKIVSGLVQAVTYEEFLPKLGVSLPAFSAYNPSLDASIINVFSAAGYRFGHTMVNGRLIRIEENGDDFEFGAIDLRDGFFNPEIIKDEGGISPFFRGLAAQKHQFVDPLIMNDIRNFLFGPPGAGGIDLLSINIARARERGVSDYNTIRQEIGLSAITSLTELTSDPELQSKLATVYTDVNDIDPWIGFMSEDHLDKAIIGEGLNALFVMQFGALRDGDRYYYENDPAFTEDEIEEIKNTKLSEILLRNTDIEVLQEDVFTAVPRDELAVEFYPFSGVMNMQLKAYPNPVQKYFNIQIEARRPSTATLNIYDASGVTVQQRAINIMPGVTDHAFELSDSLANGLYVITLVSDAGSGQLKIIKSK